MGGLDITGIVGLGPQIDGALGLGFQDLGAEILLEDTAETTPDETLFLMAGESRTLANLERTLRLAAAGRFSSMSRSSGGGSGLDGLGGGSRRNRQDDSLANLHLVRTHFNPSSPLPSNARLFDYLLLKVAYRRLGPSLTDVVVVKGNQLIGSRQLRNRFSKLSRAGSEERFIELVSLTHGRAQDSVFLRRPKNGFTVTQLFDPEAQRRYLSQYRFYRNGDPAVVVIIWNKFQREPIVLPDSVESEVVAARLARLELTEMNALLTTVYAAMGSPRFSETLAHLEGHLITMEALAEQLKKRRLPVGQKRPTSYLRPELFDRIWRFVHLVGTRAGSGIGDRTPIETSYRSAVSAVSSSLPAVP